MKTKLLIATDCFLPRWDGIARFLYEIIPKISDYFDITVATPDFPGEKVQIEGVRIVYFKTSLNIADLTVVMPSKKILSSLIAECDVVFSQTISVGPFGIGGAAVKLARKYKKPVVAYVHSIEWELFSKSIGGIFKGIINKFTKLLAKRHYNRCTKIIVPSYEIAELLDWLKVLPEKEVVHLGTNSNIFLPSKDKKEAKTKLGIPAEHTVIGYVGRIAREKDVMTLYRAFVRLRKESSLVTLLIVGDGIPALKELLMNRRNVYVTGSRSDVIRYYGAMDIFVQPSLTETTSLTVMEAMSCGLPVISTPVGYIKDYIVNGKNGMFFEKTNAFSLYGKLKMLLESPELRQSLGESARRTIVDNYNWEQTAKRIRTILENV